MKEPVSNSCSIMREEKVFIIHLYRNCFEVRNIDAALTGTLGARIPQSMGAPEPSDNCNSNGALVCFQWGDDARVEILECEDQDCFRLSWSVSLLRVVEDCLGNVIRAVSPDKAHTFSVQTLEMVTGTGARRSWCSISP